MNTINKITVSGTTYGIVDTDTKVTSAANHYTPSADSNAQLTATLSGTAGAYAKNTEYTVLTGVKAQRDAKGHVTGLTYTAQKIKDTDTTYSIATGSGNGTISVNGTDVAVKGLGSMAYKSSYTYPEITYTVQATSSAGGALTIDGSKPLHVVTLTGNVSGVTLSTAPATGHSTHVIFAAAADQTVAIAHDATARVCPGAESLELSIPAGGYAEVDFLNDGSKIYVRGV